MKKKIFFILLLALGAGNIYAQKDLSLEIIAQPGISMGGDYYAFNNIAMDKALTLNVKFGANLRLNLNKYIAISIGLLYDQMGQKYSDLTHSDDFYTYTEGKSVSLNYLKIPMLFNYTLNPEEQITFVFSAGFYLGFLISYNDIYKIFDGNEYFTATASGSSYTSDNNNNNISSSFMNGNPYNSTDFGGILAAGIQCKVSEKISLPIMLNYNIGFSSDIKNVASTYNDKYGAGYRLKLFWGDAKDPNSTSAFHNSSLGLIIGLKINL
ncbi:MAG: outer membrane beta-barrel protein [Bacteroidetes bacterium]|nr:outer membrane beta-barrel protein [Bacteroidota bacterium]